MSKVDNSEQKYKDRIKIYLDKLNSSVSNVMNIFESDTIISKCINGRDLRQIKGTTDYQRNANGDIERDNKGNPIKKVKTRGDTAEARFPNLLDSVSTTVMRDAINVAQSVYSRKYMYIRSRV